MNRDKLNQALKCLDITGVVQRASNCRLASDFYPEHSSSEPIALQFKHNVVRSEIFSIDDKDGDAPYLFRVFIDLGVRWSAARSNASLVASESTAIVEAIEPDGVIEASYVAEYNLSDKEIDPDALDEFALQNASYHVWPYFREFVTTQCSRMSAPRLTLPMVQLAANRNQDEMYEKLRD